MAVLLDQNRLVAAPEELSVLPMGAIEALGIDAIDVPHATRQPPLRSLQQQMIMIGQQAVSRDVHIPALRRLAEDFQKRRKIIRLKKNIFSSAAAIHDVVPGAREFDAKRSAHGGEMVSDSRVKANGRLDPIIYRWAATAS